MISGEKSQHIVEQLSKIVGQNINFMNDEGIIIASTDASRIGTVHEGALVVLKTKEKLLIHTEKRFPGTKAGINLPIYFENHIIGVIGITGTEPDVLKMAEIIRKITEILVKEQLNDEKNEMINQAREVFIRDWLEDRWKDDKLLSSKGWMLGLNVNLPRVAVTIQIHHEDSVLYDLQQEQNYYTGYLREAIKFNDQDLIIPVGFMHYALLITCPGTGDDEKRKEFITRKMQYIMRQMPKSDIFTIKAGVGGYYDFTRGLPASYKESEQAALHAKAHLDENIVFYDDLRLEMLLDGIKDEYSSKFVQKTLNLSQFPNPQEVIDTLALFFACNQSINKTAEQLFIHKNTLQYRLIKIKEATGYDPRVFEEAVLLYLSVYVTKNKLCND
ncbi:CdaR family transcriptional regulator [Paenibacillus apiarius]|uniref:Helix-turn-helix domain-containing protein n=1 Tax=Paenibacillus apiarius TaxID=46240 RepID=A0ABT4E194_9BACL|nr:sugar diacid recognition domain-containing protein [Paenibacillus apiarius]MCY9517448.1 helix-turn-helix domain-containing protein [Paenibacillus apiarius]MCY9522273.1 helix-turn-helix domain-containing protein [Paenibacillus apiarius]MCY9552307.1 helix-turn-helix domain-containing protein [Paenibacillus apiarius]MCY9560186.1 helix-turn-helix domain-containing protein [Paenibacillus apiarius]MCY9683804.1 helix-turn-helix domain-containing protein [Paenibacillus apiarius]